MLDIIVLTETWLNDDILNSIVNIENYFIIRNDRQTRRGGGVALFVKNNFYYEVLHDIFEKPLEIEIIYIPPNLSGNCKVNITDYFINYIDHLSTARKVNYILICGDLNDNKSNDVE